MTAINWNAAALPSTVQPLSNGLTVVVHVESKAPLAAVYVGYRAGSRDEPPSKAGLAHLCEHLMFSGTRRFPGSYFAPFEEAGASSMNAFIREDYSAYFETLPVASLELALMMEADRMANVVDVLDDERIQRQREVVINELRQRESQPYGRAGRILAELAHPFGHPYGHHPDGLVEELENVSVEDVRAWLEAHHSPAAAVVIIAGDVEPGRIFQQAERYFGSIMHPATAAPLSLPASGSGSSGDRCQIELPVDRPRLYMAWNGPAFSSVDYAALEVACELLAGTKSSRLWKRIVETERLASDLAIELRPRELGSLVTLSITAQAGAQLNHIGTLVRDEIAHLIIHGPKADELNVAHLRLFGKMMRGCERIGGPNGKSDTLGLAVMVGGSQDAHQVRLSMLTEIQPSSVAGAAKWLCDAAAVLEISSANRQK